MFFALHSLFLNTRCLFFEVVIFEFVLFSINFAFIYLRIRSELLRSRVPKSKFNVLPSPFHCTRVSLGFATSPRFSHCYYTGGFYSSCKSLKKGSNGPENHGGSISRSIGGISNSMLVSRKKLLDHLLELHMLGERERKM